MTNIEPIHWRNELGDDQWQPRIVNERLWKNSWFMTSYHWFDNQEAYESQNSGDFLTRVHPVLYCTKKGAERAARRELKDRTRCVRKHREKKRAEYRPTGTPDPRFTDTSKPPVPEQYDVEPGEFWKAKVSGAEFIGTRTPSGRWYGVSVDGTSTIRAYGNAVTLIERVKVEGDE
ncbi:hypothetical protein [Corynebacterium kalidii]